MVGRFFQFFQGYRVLKLERAALETDKVLHIRPTTQRLPDVVGQRTNVSPFATFYPQLHEGVGPGRNFQGKDFYRARL